MFLLSPAGIPLGYRQSNYPARGEMCPLGPVHLFALLAKNIPPPRGLALRRTLARNHNEDYVHSAAAARRVGMVCKMKAVGEGPIRVPLSP